MLDKRMLKYQFWQIYAGDRCIPQISRATSNTPSYAVTWGELTLASRGECDRLNYSLADMFFSDFDLL